MAAKKVQRRNEPRDMVMLRETAAIKALAHPARLVILDELTPDNELTATEIAEVAGLTPSAMSYHLRQLARWKILEEAESSDGRERRWKLRKGGWAVEPAHPVASMAAETTLVTRMLDRQRDDVLRWFAAQADEPREWIDATSMITSYLWLTSQEVIELNNLLQERIDTFRGRSDGEVRPEGARRVQLSFIAVPAVPRPRRRRV